MNLQWKQNWAAKSTNLKENAEKKVSFRHQNSPASRNPWPSPFILQELKNTHGKLVVAINTGGHSIRVLNDISVCVFCGKWFSTQFTNRNLIGSLAVADESPGHHAARVNLSGNAFSYGAMKKTSSCWYCGEKKIEKWFNVQLAPLLFS